MSVSTGHPQYNARVGDWVKCRDVFEGEAAVKRKGTIYLPSLQGQTDSEYKSYKFRALFYGITEKTVSALTGMATSIPAEKLEYPDELKPYFESAMQNHFDELFSRSLQELILQGRVGALIDMPRDGGKPYVALYNAENIINWRTDDAGNPTMVVLREETTIDVDEFESVPAIQYRELRLDGGVYIQKLHTDDGVETIYPTMPDELAGRIPFFVAHTHGLGFVDVKPPMLDIATINLSHYLSSADLEHGRHFTGLPTPVIMGASSDKPMYIGSTQFIVIPDKGGSAKYLEFTGQGLKSLETAMSEKMGLLASMSARLLDNSSRGSEAAESVKLRYTSETASLTMFVKAVNNLLDAVYEVISAILHVDKPTVKLSTDFLSTQLSAAEMKALFDGYYNGAISPQMLIYNLRKGKRIDLAEDEQLQIKQLQDARAEVELQNSNTD